MNTDGQSGANFLLPHACTYVGLVLLLPSVVFLYMFAYLGMKPAFLDVHVFAMWSTYFEARYFTVIENNLAEEITLAVLLIGLFLIAFSRVAHENEATLRLRFRALVTALYVNTGLLLLSIVFSYGLAFVSLVFVNMFSGLLFFIVIFYAGYYKRVHDGSSPR
jgi:hypothetical protein